MLGVPATHTKAVVSALVSGLIAFLSSLTTALQGEHTGFASITAGQWMTAVLAGLVGLGLTGAATTRAPNAPSTAGKTPPASPVPSATRPG